ncbi:hypothetical protein [Streptococcus loxodontisalivarius]|uniref:DUF2812 domain-containing protein n=1 Tax=Streptococcus loxodontisalivarius TaxID=1349415 RepID=A0ABS2PRU2_9STRE|nr:hypothetical protein [Streptococcus loxodontisalivarius]MBM7642763.1 hypothetical protein [Streptococcus loxodontisalivarius]
MAKREVFGDIYNLTLNQKSRVRGWNLIVAEDGSEYLMFRNLSLSSRFHRSIYQTDLSLSECRILDKQYQKQSKGARKLAILIAVVSGPIIRSLGMNSFIFGKGNIPVDFFTALRNISIVAIVIALFLALTAFLRFFHMKRFLSQKGFNLVYVGKIRPLTPYRIAPNGRQYW